MRVVVKSKTIACMRHPSERIRPSGGVLTGWLVVSWLARPGCGSVAGGGLGKQGCLLAACAWIVALQHPNISAQYAPGICIFPISRRSLRTGLSLDLANSYLGPGAKCMSASTSFRHLDRHNESPEPWLHHPGQNILKWLAPSNPGVMGTSEPLRVTAK